MSRQVFGRVWGDDIWGLSVVWPWKSFVQQLVTEYLQVCSRCHGEGSDNPQPSPALRELWGYGGGKEGPMRACWGQYEGKVAGA